MTDEERLEEIREEAVSMTKGVLVFARATGLTEVERKAVVVLAKLEGDDETLRLHQTPEEAAAEIAAIAELEKRYTEQAARDQKDLLFIQE